MLPEIKSKYHIPLLILICLPAFFINIASDHPDIMEARNFISSREMLQNGDWLIPTMSEKVRIQKPPLPVWMTATSIMIAGNPDNLFALRTPAALVGILMVVFMYLLVVEFGIGRQVAFTCGLILATSFSIIDMSRTGSWDIYCHSFMLGAILFLVRALKKPDFNWNYLWTALLFSLSFNSKGPVAFYGMLLAFLIAYIYINRKSELIHLNWIGLLVIIGVTVLLSALWPWYVYTHIPNIANEIAVEEASAWVERHNRPPWYYLHFPLFTGVWVIIVVASLVKPFKLIGDKVSKDQLRMILFWFLAAFILLSVIPEKKERYFLPALVPLVMLVGFSVENQIKFINEQAKNWFTKLANIQYWLMNVASVLLFGFFYWFGYRQSHNLPTLIGLYILIGIFLYIFIYTRKHRLPRTFYHTVCLFVALFIGFILKYAHQATAKNENYKNLTVLRDNPSFSALTFYTNDTKINPKQIWEAGKPVRQMKDYKEEQEYLLIALKPLEKQGYDFVDELHYHPKHSELTYYIYRVNR